jgi:DNA end-binding protein Ku
MPRSLWTGSLSFGLVNVPVAEVMGRTERAALGRVVMRTKEYLALIRAREERLVLTTMLWHDEVRPTDPIPSPTKKDKPAKKQVDAAIELIETFSCDWDPSRYEDSFQMRLRKIVQKKSKGQTIDVADADDEQPSPVPDLMAALERSLDEARSR